MRRWPSFQWSGTGDRAIPTDADDHRSGTRFVRQTFGRSDPAAPYDHVVISDEAQRAWDQKKIADFMKGRKKIPDVTQSEPTFLISYLDRYDAWAVIIRLVGGGQERHDGEAGIAEWLDTLRLTFGHRRVFLSPDLTGSEHVIS